MSIRDRLTRLDGGDSSSPSSGDGAPGEEWVNALQRELHLAVLQEEGAFILLKENTYPIYREPAFAELREQGFDAPHLHRITEDLSPELCNLRQALFVDTETTGLAGGTGTYAFLIGIGHLELDHVVVRQYLLPDFSHEWLMLKHLDQALQGFRFTVTFNGKSFDLPLLRTRYLMNRMIPTIEDMAHFDLLHAARRLWKRRLPACDLQTLERHILGVERVQDVPGELIPHLYFEFIRRRDALLLRDVLEHNFHDIVNLALLTVRMAAICRAPLEYLEHPEEMLSLAGYLFRQKRFPEAIELLEGVLATEGANAAFRREALFLLSQAYKKQGKAEASKQRLQELMERQVLHPQVIEELAKIYEHQERDFPAARAVVEKGLAYLETIRRLDPRSDLLKYIPALQHRLRRLQRRMGKTSDGISG
ncbi:MAG: hypothetical protein D6681_21400 [Calditrichaeota bacterium]|nr:MAG: hypothetical protein D6681_21400 [Calditrichota bacterium]